MYKENDKIIEKASIGHRHAHSFEEVVSNLYDYPESFSISKEEEEFYSKQELEYLNRVQKYLLFIGLKDIKSLKKTPLTRYRNKIHSKYSNQPIYKYDDEKLNKMLKGIINYRVIKWYPEYEKREYKPKEYQALIVDKDNNFIMHIEFTHEEVKNYQEIKSIHNSKKLKDDDKVILLYFKILEKFN